MASNKGCTTAAVPPNPTVDPFAYLGIVLNSDGSITRQQQGILTAASDPSHNSPIFTKDIPINKSNNTWLRIYVPTETLDSSSSHDKLPLIVYFHGSGFIVGSVAFQIFHNFCETMAVQIPAIVVSVEYRLAPCNRLPAAYLDAVEALHGIKTTNEEWLLKYADFSKCYLMGGSAGANIAYHAAAFLGDEDLGHLKIQGLILHQPYFGGTGRTKSELRLIDDKVLPLVVNDLMWELALPIGTDRDHEYSNLTVGGGWRVCDEIKRLGWKVLVTGCDGDPLVDRQVELVTILKEKGVETVSKFGEGDCHGIELFDPSKAKALYLVIQEFI